MKTAYQNNDGQKGERKMVIHQMGGPADTHRLNKLLNREYSQTAAVTGWVFERLRAPAVRVK